MKLISEKTSREISAILDGVSKIRGDVPPRYIDLARRAGNTRKRLTREECKDADSQCRAILDYLSTGKGLTPMDALNLFGCFRLSGRIWDLRRAGYSIETHTVVKDGKRFAKYYLKTEII